MITADGQTRRQIGAQQMLLSKHSFGWHRTVEYVPVPEGVTAMAPGVMIYPPDPQNADPRGKMHVGAIYSVESAKGPFQEPVLSPSLFAQGL